MASSRESSSFTVIGSRMIGLARPFDGQEKVGLRLRWGAVKRFVLAFIELVGKTAAGEAWEHR